MVPEGGGEERGPLESRGQKAGPGKVRRRQELLVHLDNCPDFFFSRKARNLGFYVNCPN